METEKSAREKMEGLHLREKEAEEEPRHEAEAVGEAKAERYLPLHIRKWSGIPVWLIGCSFV